MYVRFASLTGILLSSLLFSLSLSLSLSLSKYGFAP